MNAPDWPLLRNAVGVLRVCIQYRARPRIYFEPTGWRVAESGLPYWFARSPLSELAYGLAPTKTQACRMLLDHLSRRSPR